jgi:hypothetical protein
MAGNKKQDQRWLGKSVKMILFYYGSTGMQMKEMLMMVG